MFNFTYDIKVIKKAVNTEHEKCKWLVFFFLGKIENQFYAREIKIAKKLLKENPEVEVWEKIKIKNKLPSLAFFLTEDGSKMVKKEFSHKTLALPIKKEYDLTQETEPPAMKVTNNKPKTTLDFLK